MGELPYVQVSSLNDLAEFSWSDFQDSGVLLGVDKPVGITSHDVVAIVRREASRVLGRKLKVGHAGTLDPLASGLLLVLVGKHATKRQHELMKLTKVYSVDAWWGMSSSTYDLDGVITINTKFGNSLELLVERLHEIKGQFEGEIFQQVPAYSAVKVGGKALYKHARGPESQPVELPVKKVEVLNLQFGESVWLDLSEMVTFFNQKAKERMVPAQYGGYFRKQQEVVDTVSNTIEQLSVDGVFTTPIVVSCSSGTYIRSLVHDMGSMLECGGVVAALRRLSVGGFSFDTDTVA